MAQKKLADSQRIAFWREAGRRLSLVDRDAPVTLGRVDRLLDALPEHYPQEMLGNWLRRVIAASGASADSSAANIIPLRAKPQWRFTPLANIKRLAADSNGSGVAPLPDPGRTLETEDGRFRLTVTAEDGHVHLLIETLGFAADLFAGRRLGITGPCGEDELIAIIELDDDGDGWVSVKDQAAVRRALLHPVIGLLEDA